MPNFDDALAKTPLKLGLGWKIFPVEIYGMSLLIHVLISDEMW